VNKNVTEERLTPIRYIFEHGGSKLGEKIIDLSSNQNPLGQPSFIKDVTRNLTHIHLQKFPNTEKVIENLSYIEEIERDLIYPTPGASVGILIIFLYFKPKICIIPDITYVDYIRICKELNIKMITTPTVVIDRKPMIDLEYLREISQKYDNENTIIILVNPNNPTGTFIELEKLKDFIENVGKSKILLDITFIDFVNQQSKCRELLNYDNVIIIKSLSKIISTPGVRVGYIAGKSIREIPKLSWPLSILSELILEKIVSNLREYKTFIEKTYNYVSKEIERLVSILVKNLKNINIYRSHTHMFIFKASERLYDILLNSYNIKVRKYCILSNGEVLYRASIRDRETNDLLIRALLMSDKYA